MELSEILIRLRREKGLSQAELAQELGITRQTISRWEAGKARPSAENLVSLGRVYGMTVEELVAGEKREETAMEAVPPVTEEKISEPGTPEEPEQAKPRRKMTLWALLLVVCLCVGVYIWGVLTHSRVEASMLIQFVVIFAVLEWLVHAILRAIASHRNKKEPSTVEEKANLPQKKSDPSRRKGILVGLVALGYVLIYLVGVLTNSRAMASITLAYLTFLIILAWILYSLYVIVEHVKKADKEEGLSEEEANLPQKKSTPSRRKGILVGFVAACVCGGLLLWGKLTNSMGTAATNLVLVFFAVTVGWILYSLNVIVKYLRRNDEK